MNPTLFLKKWFFWGYSLAFSDTGGRFIGDLSEPFFFFLSDPLFCVIC